MNYILPKLFHDNVWWSWQNLKAKSERGLHGRAWLHILKTSLGVDWSILQRTIFSLEVYVGGAEDDFVLGISLLIFSLYLSVKDLLPYRALPRGWHRTTGISIHDGTIWIDIWNDNSWSGRGKKKWQNINIHIVDILLGKKKYSERDLYTQRVDVVMPEGSYPATVRMFESTWQRKRWPFMKQLIRADIKPDKPIPFPGKGENSWDCDDDATYEMTCQANTPQKAVAKLVESVMSRRKS